MSKEKTKELIDALPEAIQAVFKSDKTFKTFLTTMSRFHRYSPNNALLIWSQKPDATRVASFTTWKSLGRLIRKNQRGIRILCPHTFKVTNEETNEQETHVGFHIGYCWDISSTYGEDLPEICNPIDADVVGYQSLLNVLCEISPVPVEFGHIDSGARGFFSPSVLKIRVSDEMSEADVIKTLIHEQAHAWLHSHDTEEKLTRNAIEVEAEAVSFVCCNVLEIENNYSPQYIASWSTDKTVPELREFITDIHHIADHILDLIEDKMNVGLPKESVA